MPPPCGWHRACASADGRNRLRCPDRRRSPATAARPPGSTGRRECRASPHRAIADRRERTPTDVRVARRRRETAETPAGGGLVPAAAEAPAPAAALRWGASIRGRRQSPPPPSGPAPPPPRPPPPPPRPPPFSTT